MRCILCQRFSVAIICARCRNTLLQPTPLSRTLDNTLKVYSFYRYDDIADLIKTKHTHIGAAVYRILATNASAWFHETFLFEEDIGIVPVDDRPESGYAHTAIVAKALQNRYLHPCYGALRARNRVTYSAKTLAYRQSHPRGFLYRDRGYKHVVIVDDLVTTGTTLKEAKAVIEKSGVRVLFALTLATAQNPINM